MIFRLDLGQPSKMRCTPGGFFFTVAQRSSRCLYTLLLIELPTPVVSCLCCLFEVFCRFGPDPCVICDFADCFLCLFGGFISLMVVDSNRFKQIFFFFFDNVPVVENWMLGICDVADSINDVRDPETIRFSDFQNSKT